ncbi:hypothetical protein BKA82DRAFT_1001545 [Pisolithus tinctorius]|uniref:Uncharacterized protein n=1 Tax=Pisolithus tinctorius Marx 270 TaxID=870435 RepID=A0A0C3K105_PISTI|nr:hypothetical protein BKA82DRAFT_1001545 [Pisolithus tinctorius]KIO03272.1 hypothetical protein M404DRAFT_1001545 [Pisolithus tinctorius Marx 270]
MHGVITLWNMKWRLKGSVVPIFIVLHVSHNVASNVEVRACKLMQCEETALHRETQDTRHEFAANYRMPSGMGLLKPSVCKVHGDVF